MKETEEFFRIPRFFCSKMTSQNHLSMARTTYVGIEGSWILVFLTTAARESVSAIEWEGIRLPTNLFRFPQGEGRRGARSSHVTRGPRGGPGQ